jgi:sugar transferase (PEP-CTERM/EpsH1 system associated)
MTTAVTSIAYHPQQQAIHICHLVWSFRTGGLENGVVNLINQLDPQQFKHSIVCLTDYDADFIKRIQVTNVKLYSLHKRPGQDPRSFVRAYKLLRQLQPDVCHSRNIAALEYQLCAWLARVPLRIHGEHGWDIKDLAGVNKKYIWLKRFFKRFVNQYVCLSKEGKAYLQQKIKVPSSQLNLICNGVDTEKFSPKARAQSSLPPSLRDSQRMIFVSVGRMVPVKNHPLLVSAYIELCQQDAAFKEQTALVIVGDGTARTELMNQLQHAGLDAQSWLPGNRDDIASILVGCSVFVLPSLAEGISNTILEAMASGLAIIASKVGGNPDLVEDGSNGWLFESQNLTALKQRLYHCYQQPAQLQQSCQRARNAAVLHFSIQSMVSRYQALYLQRLPAITYSAEDA